MKSISRGKMAHCAFTLVETVTAVGIGTLILAGFTMASVALQRSFVAIEDYTKGTNDQMRISDYLALDMRRAYSVTLSGDCANPPLTVTVTIPNFYKSADTPNDPHVQGVTGWPYKKHHHHHHQNIILNQVISYGNSWSGTTMTDPTLTVTYVFDNSAYTLTRTVKNSSGTQIYQENIATDVKDFCVTVNDLDETANTQITFRPRFRSLASSDEITGTTYFQTTLMRNTR
jgi:hypothetical protein